LALFPICHNKSFSQPTKPFQENCVPATISDGWRQVAEAVRDEQDPRKLRQLAEQLNRELKARSETSSDGREKILIDAVGVDALARRF
jgi:hypothetical protein